MYHGTEARVRASLRSRSLNIFMTLHRRGTLSTEALERTLNSGVRAIC